MKIESIDWNKIDEHERSGFKYSGISGGVKQVIEKPFLRDSGRDQNKAEKNEKKMKKKVKRGR